MGLVSKLYMFKKSITSSLYRFQIYFSISFFHDPHTNKLHHKMPFKIQTATLRKKMFEIITLLPSSNLRSSMSPSASTVCHHKSSAHTIRNRFVSFFNLGVRIAGSTDENEKSQNHVTSNHFSLFSAPVKNQICIIIYSS